MSPSKTDTLSLLVAVRQEDASLSVEAVRVLPKGAVSETMMM